ncbi:MAG: hypothetical protein ACMUIS_02250 [bacterium]
MGDSSGPDTRYAILIASDTGTGMSKKILGKVFDPFFTTKGHVPRYQPQPHADTVALQETMIL